jgi:hypothetical protein
MFPRLKILLLLALLGCAGAAYADPPGRAGRLNHVSGIVSFASAEAPEEWGEAVLNRPLTTGDRLWVERDGRAEFHLGSTAVRMSGYTALDVLDLDDDRLRLRLAEGTLNLRVRDLDRDDVIEIATAMGGILLREPGSYRVSVDSQQGAARVTVNAGRAEVTTPERAFNVPSSQAAVFAAGAAPLYEVAARADGDEFDRWSVERDRREDRAVSAKYVSRQMTGYEDLDEHGSWRSVTEYGHVWVPSHVPPGWAPYRQGHWAWISPWGWTWIDDAPWGFAPFHYGRWVWLDRHWAWAPGPIARRPVYAPALVAFVGGAGWSVSATRGPAVGWFPLGWREPFVPWYRASTRHVHAVNVTHVTNITTTGNVRHVHRGRTDAVTVVSQQTFVSSRSAWRERHRVGHEDLMRAEVIRNRPPAEPARASFAQDRPAARPPAEFRSRDTAVMRPPASFTREAEPRVVGTQPGDRDTREQRVIGAQGERDARDRRGQRDTEAVAVPSNPARQREREHRERLARKEAAERPHEAQQRQVQTAPTTRPPTQQGQPVQQTQPSRNVPSQQAQAQGQQSQAFRSPPPPQPQAQGQQPQASRSYVPQARQQSNDDRGSGERRAQRQTRDRD